MIKSLQMEIGGLKEQILNLKLVHNKDITEKNFEIQNLKQVIADGEAKLKQAKRERDDVESQKNNQIMKLKQEIKDLQDQMEALGKDSGSQVRELQAKIKQLMEDHEANCAQMN